VPYCRECGSPMQEEEVAAVAVAEAAEATAEGQVGAAAEIGGAEVRIAEINADKEIRLARIQAKMLDADNEAAVEQTVIAAEVAAETETDPEPVVMVDASSGVDEPEEAAPPAAEDTPEPAAARKQSRNPWWG
jgi:hypothetical protein